MTSEEHIRAAVEQARDVTDPTERALLIGRLLAAIRDASAELRALRQEDVLKLRDTPMTYAAIAETLSVTRGRVDQIAKGK